MKFKSLSILLLPFDEFDQGEFSVWLYYLFCEF